MNKRLAAVAGATVLLAACSDSPTPTQLAAPSAAAAFAAAVGPEYVPGEVIVKFRAGASAATSLLDADEMLRQRARSWKHPRGG